MGQFNQNRPERRKGVRWTGLEEVKVVVLQCKKYAITNKSPAFKVPLKKTTEVSSEMCLKV